jgi:hypothetical protein
MIRRSLVLLVELALGATIAGPVFAEGDPLPSWNEGPVKRAIVSFVDKVSNEGTPDFVPVSERIAAFDNDGTLWCEQPISATRTATTRCSAGRPPPKGRAWA